MKGIPVGGTRAAASPGLPTLPGAGSAWVRRTSVLLALMRFPRERADSRRQGSPRCPGSQHQLAQLVSQAPSSSPWRSRAWGEGVVCGVREPQDPQEAGSHAPFPSSAPTSGLAEGHPHQERPSCGSQRSAHGQLEPRGAGVSVRGVSPSPGDTQPRARRTAGRRDPGCSATTPTPPDPALARHLCVVPSPRQSAGPSSQPRS